MKRKHLFEIEDQSWCPNLLRETITDFLVALYSKLGLFEPAYNKIIEILHKTQAPAIIDCCSGSGGPMRQLRAFLDAHAMSNISITLTDKYPNQVAFTQLEKEYGDRLKGFPTTIDACNLPASLPGLRCFFSSFHHFKPDQAKQILMNAVAKREPIAIFESTERRLLDCLRACFSPIIMLVLLPFAKRLNFKKCVFTYLIPIAPLVFMWDYLVSNLRTYSEKELWSLVQQITEPHYHWEIGKLWSKKAKSSIPYLIGYPKLSVEERG